MKRFLTLALLPAVVLLSSCSRDGAIGPGEENLSGTLLSSSSTDVLSSEELVLSSSAEEISSSSGPLVAAECATSEKLGRVVGYLPSYRTSWIKNIDWSQLTHIALAFFNPDADGHFTSGFTDTNLTTIVDSAHANNVKVLLSLGGGGNPDHTIWNDLMSEAKTDLLADSLVALLNRVGADGIDVDLEGSLVTDRYGAVVTAIRDALPKGALLTAATAQWNGKSFTDDALAALDFLNLMAYDAAGTWGDKGDHSPYSKATGDLEYWNNTRNIPAEKLVLGVPFYGYWWKYELITKKEAGDYTYNTMILMFPDKEEETYWHFDNGDNTWTWVSWNSSKMIDKKACLAREYGGIMIWELGQDVEGDQSLLGLIDQHR